MAKSGTKRVVLTALAGNAAIVVTKLIAFFYSGSSAMLTECIHSVVDSGNQLLLLIGQTRAKLPPDEDHPFGHGMESYFWSFIVALMIFLMGGAVSIWQGVTKVLHPEPVEYPLLSFAVLAFSAVFEGFSFHTAYREFRSVVRGRDVSLFEFLQASKDPNLFGTLIEDGAALIGLTIAAAGVAGAAYLGLAWADGAASIAIGLLLVGISGFLANETRSLIAGESAAAPIVEAARKAAVSHAGVAQVDDLVSLHLGPRAILIVLSLVFPPGIGSDAADARRRELARRVKETDERIREVLFRPTYSCSEQSPS